MASVQNLVALMPEMTILPISLKIRLTSLLFSPYNHSGSSVIDSMQRL